MTCGLDNGDEDTSKAYLSSSGNVPHSREGDVDITKCYKARPFEFWLLGTYFKLGTKAHIGYVVTTIVWPFLFPQMKNAPLFEIS